MIQVRRSHLRFSLLILGLVLLCTLPVLLHPGWIAYWPTAIYNDLLLSHLPLSRIVHDSLFTWMQAPLWNPYLLSGMPLAADPLAGMTYPPNWLAILWPTGYAVNLIFIGHLFWAAIGAWRLARAQGADPAHALVSGVLFGASAKLIAHLSLGHLGLVSAVSWTPWLLLGLRDLVQATSKHDWRTAGWPGLVLGLLFLADSRWLIPAGLLAAAYVFVLIRDLPSNTGYRRLAIRGLQLVLLAVGVSACLSLPLLELLGLSTRTGISLVEQSVFSLNAFDLLGMVVYLPLEPEQFVYLGSTALFLSMLAFLKPDRLTWFWGAVGVVAVLLAIGSGTPVFTFFSAVIPGANLLRVPARFFLLAILSIALLAARGAALLDPVADANFQRRARLVGAGFFLFVILINAAVWMARGLQSPAGVLPLVAAVGGLLLLVPIGSWHTKRSWFLGAWILLLLLETAGVDLSLLKMRPIQDTPSSAFAAVLERHPGEQRVFSPTFSIIPLVAAERKIETVEGISPLQLSTYRAYLGSTLGFDPAGYTVPMPPLTEALNLDAYQFDQLADLNVAWILSSQPLAHAKLRELQVLDGVHLYQFLDAGERIAFIPTQEGGSAHVTRWTPNRISIQASGGGRLVLHEVMYPGWVGRIDGRPADVYVEDGLFRAIEIPSGEHEVEFVFMPGSVYLGWAVSLLTVVVLWMGARRR